MSADQIQLLYRCKASTLNDSTNKFLARHYSKLYSPMFRRFTPDVRMLFSNIAAVDGPVNSRRPDKSKAGLFEYEATHLINKDTNRFWCEEILTTSKAIKEDGYFEIRLQPSTLDERNKLIEFDKDEGDAGIGVRAMNAYFEDLKRNQPDFYEGIKLINGVSASGVIEKFLEFSKAWEDDVRIYDFTLNQKESGKSDLSILMMLKENYAYYLRFDCTFH